VKRLSKDGKIKISLYQLKKYMSIYNYCPFEAVENVHILVDDDEEKEHGVENENWKMKTFTFLKRSCMLHHYRKLVEIGHHNKTYPYLRDFYIPKIIEESDLDNYITDANDKEANKKLLTSATKNDKLRYNYQLTWNSDEDKKL